MPAPAPDGHACAALPRRRCVVQRPAALAFFSLVLAFGTIMALRPAPSTLPHPLPPPEEEQREPSRTGLHRGLHRGPLHRRRWDEREAARRRCDAEALWTEVPAADLVYSYHPSTAARLCGEPGQVATPEGRSGWRDTSTDACTAATRRAAQLLFSPPDGLPFRCASRLLAPAVLLSGAAAEGRSEWRGPMPRQERCTVAVGSAARPANWTFDRLGPFVGEGGYDWHSFLSPSVGGAALREGVGISAWLVAPTTAAGSVLDFPPVHMHHAHVRSAGTLLGFGAVRGACEARFVADRAGRGSEEGGGLLLESHADLNCNEPGGVRCFMRTLPEGTAMRVAGELMIDAQLNDVRPRGSPPMPFYLEAALRLSPAEAAGARGAARRAAMLTVGNPTPGRADTVSRGAGTSVAHGRTDGPALFAFSARVTAAVFGADATARGEGVPRGQLDVLDVFPHSHQRAFASMLLLACPLADLGLPPLPAPYEPRALPGRSEMLALRARLLRRPELRCWALRPALRRVDGRLFDRRPRTDCVAGWTVAEEDVLSVVFLDDFEDAPAAADADAAVDAAAGFRGGDESDAHLAPQTIGMGGFVGETTVLPQHYYVRLIVSERRAGELGDGRGLRTCCLPVGQYINASAKCWDEMARWDEYRPALGLSDPASPQPVQFTRRLPEAGDGEAQPGHLRGNVEWWEWVSVEGCLAFAGCG